MYVYEFLRRFLYRVRLWNSYFFLSVSVKSILKLIAQKGKMATLWTLSSQRYPKQEMLTCAPNNDDSSVLELTLKYGPTPKIQTPSRKSLLNTGVWRRDLLDFISIHFSTLKD